MAELRYGAEYSQYPERNKAMFDIFLADIEILPITPCIPAFALEKARLRKLGQPLPDFDLLIGATAIYHDMTLVTNNTKHFQRLGGIKLEDWKK